MPLVHSFCTDFSVLELYLADSGKYSSHPGIPCIQKICIVCTAYKLYDRVAFLPPPSSSSSSSSGGFMAIWQTNENGALPPPTDL